MEDEACGGSDHVPSNLTVEFSGAGVDSDNTASSAQEQSNSERSVVHLVHLPAMADRRNRVERACSNMPAAQSRNNLPQHRRHDDAGGVPEARNRHRDRNPPNTGRPRAAPNNSANQRAFALLEPEVVEDYGQDGRSDGADDISVAVNDDVTTNRTQLLPILQTEFVQGAQSPVPSAHNWQVCY